MMLSMRLAFKEKLLLGIVPGIVVLLYAFFIGAIYVYRFSEDEALILASYPRYMNIAFFFLYIVAIYAIVTALNARKPLNYQIIAVMCYVLILCSRTETVENYLFRNTVSESIAFWSGFDRMIDGMDRNCEQGSKVYLLSRNNRNDKGLYQGVLRYALRSRRHDVSGFYSLGPEAFEGDTLSKDIDPSDWMDELIEGQYEYVAIHVLGNDFLDNYGECFENPDDVQDDTVYRVNAQSRKLIRCN